jgi:cytochrome oxidase Cu insertion factor (SCO1/SenC/PrrC family)
MKRLFLLLLPLLTAAALFGQDVPRPAPAFSVTLPSGKAVSLTDYKGKVILLAGLLTT